MFTSWDKAIAAFVTSLAAMAVGAGIVSDDQAGTALEVLLPLVSALAVALATYLAPNKGYGG